MSPGGTKVVLDDTGPSLTVETPGKNKILVDDATRSIALIDQHGNSVTLNADGITLKSSKDLHIKADGGQVVIEGKEVDVQ